MKNILGIAKDHAHLRGPVLMIHGTLPFVGLTHLSTLFPVVNVGMDVMLLPTGCDVLQLRPETQVRHS